jgi:2-polyprenyl-3-methyl-5-hydroxy-6-metoxy-1,4-benzoquinol methylase
VNYLWDAFSRRAEPIACPSCGSSRAHLVDQKYLVTRLFECESCYLNFRHPTESQSENRMFYQRSYTEGDGITTYLPSPREVDDLRRTGFAAFPQRSISRLLPVIEHCFADRPRLKILDYGASWGYMTYQFHELGHDVEGYEISVPRAKFGHEALGVNIQTSLDALSNEFDLFFSSHVIEHVPKPAELIATARAIVNESGYCIILCPNGSPPFQRKHPKAFHLFWGKVHPNLPTAAFFQQAFRDNPYFIATSENGLTDIADWQRTDQTLGDDLSGPELFVVARPRIQV